VSQCARFSLNKIAVPATYKKGRWNTAVRNKNERVELEMRIMKYRQFLHRIADESFQKELNAKIADMERKLREIDE